MLTLTYETLDNKVFLAALEKIDNMPGQELDGKTVYDFNKIKTTTEKEFKLFREAFRALHERMCELDDDGKIKMEDGRPVIKDLEAFRDELAAFHAVKFEVKSSLLDREQIMKCGLSIKELRACSEILTPSVKEVNGG